MELETPAGKNDGSVGGVYYFQCLPKHGKVTWIIIIIIIIIVIIIIIIIIIINNSNNTVVNN